MLKVNALGFMVIFGKDERAKVEVLRKYSFSLLSVKNSMKRETYRDGKW